jgi:ABC-type nitrate/sulfonate/bicarbonate transport system permease component
MSQSLRQFAGYFAGFASLFLAWHVAATHMFTSVLFPPPLKVLATAIELARDGSLGENAAVS